VSDADPTEVFDAENVIVCQFDKVWFVCNWFVLLPCVSCAKHGTSYDHICLNVCPSRGVISAKTGLQSRRFHQMVVQKLVFSDVEMLWKFKGYCPQRDNFLQFYGIWKALEKPIFVCNQAR